MALTANRGSDQTLRRSCNTADPKNSYDIRWFRAAHTANRSSQRTCRSEAAYLPPLDANSAPSTPICNRRRKRSIARARSDSNIRSVFLPLRASASEDRSKSIRSAMWAPCLERVRPRRIALSSLVLLGLRAISKNIIQAMDPSRTLKGPSLHKFPDIVTPAIRSMYSPPLPAMPAQAGRPVSTEPSAGDAEAAVRTRHPVDFWRIGDAREIAGGRRRGHVRSGAEAGLRARAEAQARGAPRSKRPRLTPLFEPRLRGRQFPL
jgi:hypothetical protein